MLTHAQKKTLNFIKNFIKKHEEAPTSSEIAEGIGITSRGVVHRYLKALAEAGYIELITGRHRNIKLLDTIKESLTRLPILGAIAAGQPIEAIQDNQTVDVANIFAGPHRYALRVKGDSMIEEGILDGDLVICEHTAQATNGQIVVALIDQQEATLKRLQYANNKHTISLFPANPNYKPMHYPSDRVQIQGIYIGLIRESA